ncbi:MAG: DUF86 domain-containing protein [Acetobacteraceae bacterium]|nr:DUF86 domain-containing protein [Acetobacteraceae bacterium]
MLDAIAGIAGTVEGLDLSADSQDWLRKRATERGFEIVSGASRRIPADLKARHPHIPWRKIAGLGNVLRHEEQHIQDGMLWAAIHEDVVPLKRALVALRDGLPGYPTGSAAHPAARSRSRGTP